MISINTKAFTDKQAFKDACKHTKEQAIAFHKKHPEVTETAKDIAVTTVAFVTGLSLL